MKNKKVIIYRIMVSLTKDGFEEKEYQFEGHETKSCFIVTHESKRERRVKKDKIMKPDTGTFMISHKMMHYVVWCMPDQVQQAKQKCKEAVIRQANIIREEASALFKYLE